MLGLQVELNWGQGPSQPVGSIVAERGRLQAVPSASVHPALGVGGAIFPEVARLRGSGRLWDGSSGKKLKGRSRKPWLQSLPLSGGLCWGCFCVGDVQEAHCDPGHEVLWERGGGPC